MIGSCAQFARALLDWYDRCQRKLPWRASRRGRGVDPWAVFVSELMLQQTQVATVIPYFTRFMNRFPTPVELAAADEQEVLRLWQGLGYYARARHLRAAACKIVADFAGTVPNSLAELGSLPGVGRYTAGAVASIAYGLRAPILDGNVARVLCRLERIRSSSGPGRRARLWRVAEQILPHQRVGDFNSALMDLGATICTPKSPRCEVCPVRRFCKAAAAGVQNSIPSSPRRDPTPLLRRWTICVQRNGRWLLEQRPASGRWAGMWQFVTFAADGPGGCDSGTFQRNLGIRITGLRRLGRIRQALTHRRFIFDVFTAAAVSSALPASQPPRRWLRLTELDEYPLPRAHVKIAAMLRSRGRKPAGKLN
jgi:A/G-specific adenine glycosylase